MRAISDDRPGASLDMTEKRLLNSEDIPLVDVGRSGIRAEMELDVNVVFPDD
jgi:hypothetical protein